MKILIVSDTHGRHGNLDAVLEKEGKIDLLLHLGDVEDAECYYDAIAEWPYHMVSGNNDYFSRLPKDKEIQIGKYKVWMTHGHNYYVSISTEKLRDAARARGVDVVLFGHTHEAVCWQEEDGLWVMNPGSCGYGGGKAGIMEVNNGEIEAVYLIDESKLEEMLLS